jgi:hypothetical protein
MGPALNDVAKASLRAVRVWVRSHSSCVDPHSSCVDPHSSCVDQHSSCVFLHGVRFRRKASVALVTTSVLLTGFRTRRVEDPIRNRVRQPSSRRLAAHQIGRAVAPQQSSTEGHRGLKHFIAFKKGPDQIQFDATRRILKVIATLAARLLRTAPLPQSVPRNHALKSVLL